MRYLLILLVFFSACKGIEKNGHGPYGLPIDFSEEAQRLDSIHPAVLKTVYLDGETETLIDDSVHFDVELEAFRLADFDQPKFKGRYDVDTIVIERADRTIIRYTARDAELDVREAEYYFEQGELTEVRMVVERVNGIYNSSRLLKYKPGSSYEIWSGQRVDGVFELESRVEGEFVEGAKRYLGVMDLGGEELIFEFDRYANHTWVIRNGTERIFVDDVRQEGDTLVLKMPVFRSEFHVAWNGKIYQGYWLNLDKADDYKITFTGRPDEGELERFAMLSSNYSEIRSVYEVTFGDGQDAYAAIGLFERHKHQVYGSFATETGDYRHLQGVIIGDSLRLSGFDGAHAFHFTATIDSDGALSNGVFYSGTHYQSTWSGIPNDKAELRDADTLTYLKEGYTEVAFEALSLDGETVTLSDERFQGKPVIITLMGSWCPNCMDESKYLSGLYRKHHDQGLEVVGLAFERKDDLEFARPVLQEMIEDLDIPYDVLLAGRASKNGAAEKLPMLNHVMSFPTMIVLDRNHEVQMIHTGFYGPGTGTYYEEFVEEMNTLLQKVL